MNTTTVLATVSAREFQRNYKSVFAKANKTNEPIMVISNNQPQVVILGLKQMEEYNKFMIETNFWKAVREIQSQNRYNDPITTQIDIDEAVDEARQKVYDKYYSSPRQQRARKRPSLSSKPTRKDHQSLARKKIQDNYLPTNG